MSSYFMNVSNSYYVPIFEQMTWGEATRKCKDIDPLGHLAIVRSADEYEQLKDYLASVHGK
jgi:hypothetical protein